MLLNAGLQDQTSFGIMLKLRLLSELLGINWKGDVHGRTLAYTFCSLFFIAYYLVHIPARKGKEIQSVRATRIPGWHCMHLQTTILLFTFHFLSVVFVLLSVLRLLCFMFSSACFLSTSFRIFRFGFWDFVFGHDLRSTEDKAWSVLSKDHDFGLKYPFYAAGDVTKSWRKYPSLSPKTRQKII